MEFHQVQRRILTTDDGCVCRTNLAVNTTAVGIFYAEFYDGQTSPAE
jgi:hypothetical protein